MRLITWIMMFAESKMDCWCRLEQHKVCGIVIIRVFRYGEKLQGSRAYSGGWKWKFRRLPSVIRDHSVANISSAHLHRFGRLTLPRILMGHLSSSPLTCTAICDLLSALDCLSACAAFFSSADRLANFNILSLLFLLLVCLGVGHALAAKNGTEYGQLWLVRGVSFSLLCVCSVL